MSMTVLVILEIPSIIFGVFQKLLLKHIIKKKTKACEKKKERRLRKPQKNKHIVIAMYEQEYRCAD